MSCTPQAAKPCLRDNTVAEQCSSSGKGGKLQGKGDANRYGKVFSDRPPLLEVHAVVAEAYGCCVFPRRCLLCRVSSPVGVRRANNIFPARFVFIEAVRPPQ